MFNFKNVVLFLRTFSTEVGILSVYACLKEFLGLRKLGIVPFKVP